MDIKCPICGSPLTATTYEENDGYCRYTDYVCRCKVCNLFEATGAADNYYGREYFATKELFMIDVSKRIEKAKKTKEQLYEVN